MKHLFHSRVIQLSTPRYRAATLVAFVAFTTLVMMLTTAATYASTPKTPNAYGTTLTSGTISGTVIPNSASGCNQSVCIAVCNNSSCTGRGLYVDHVISTAVSTARTGSVVGQMLVRGSVRETTNRVRWINPSGNRVYLYAYYPVRYNINNGSKVCVRWSGLGAPAGLPCETVHS